MTEKKTLRYRSQARHKAVVFGRVRQLLYTHLHGGYHTSCPLQGCLKPSLLIYCLEISLRALKDKKVQVQLPHANRSRPRIRQLRALAILANAHQIHERQHEDDLDVLHVRSSQVSLECLVCLRMYAHKSLAAV